MEESGDSRVVLDYGDILLRRGDVLSLMEGEWLNDQVISFYFEYLKTSSKFSNLLGVELLHTSLVHLISCMPDQDQVDMILEPLALAQKDLVFAAVNDSEDTSQPDSGSHWSLLVCERTRGAFSFYHFDSMGDSNRAPALALAAKLRGHLGSGGSLESVSEIPRQTNCHDCGVYVLAVAEAILKEREGSHDVPCCESFQRELSAGDGAEDLARRVEGMREDVVKLINRLSLRGRDSSPSSWFGFVHGERTNKGPGEHERGEPRLPWSSSCSAVGSKPGSTL